MDAPQEPSSLNFQRIVIIIAIIMLIIAMIFIGYALYGQHTDIAWPPENTPTCPDFWTVNPDGKTCKNETGMPNNKCEYNGIPGGLPGPTCPP
jgi:hypothetical protein